MARDFRVVMNDRAEPTWSRRYRAEAEREFGVGGEAGPSHPERRKEAALFSRVLVLVSSRLSRRRPVRPRASSFVPSISTVQLSRRRLAAYTSPQLVPGQRMRLARRTVYCPCSLGLSLMLLAGSVRAQSSASGEWLAYGHDALGSRYSPLAQITRDNVNQLAPVSAVSPAIPPRPRSRRSTPPAPRSSRPTSPRASTPRPARSPAWRSKPTSR